MTALEAFEGKLGYRLDAFQRTACQCLEDGSSVLVAAPTGAGKTTVAEFAVALARREFDLEIVYTAPIKALSNQKHAELCAEYGADQVALLTGDVTLNPDAPIKVMTTEVLRNIIYADPARLERTHSVVLDEVHFLGDRFRGPVWEEIILHLPQHIKIVGLSATVSNAEELGDWMHLVRGNTEVIISEERPVPLYQHVFTGSSLLPMYVRGRFNPEIVRLKPLRKRSRSAAPRRQAPSRISAPQVVHALQETGLTPAIYFIFSRIGCDQAVTRCVADGISLTTRSERLEIRAAAQQVLQQLTPSERRALRLNSWLRGLERGVAAHHAGLLPQQKLIVEQLFQQRLVKVVFATETLALGINMPAKAVVIEKLKKFNGDERVYLSSGEFTQLTGRAGRRGIDTEGHAIILWENSLDLEVLEGLTAARTYPVLSSFRPTYNMAVNLLRSREVAVVRDVLERSFAQFQADRSLAGDAMQLQRMQESLQGYQNAIAAATDVETARRWEARAQKLSKQMRSLTRQLNRRTGNISRVFERVITVLRTLGYLAEPTTLAAQVALVPASLPEAVYSQQLVSQTAQLEVLRPTVWGLALARIHGEKALLAAECLRSGAWEGLDAYELAAIVSCLTYEPRRNDAGYGTPLSGAYDVALERTAGIFMRLDALEEDFALPQTLAPFAYNAWVMHAWAREVPLDEILEHSELNVGDFLRWVKQTADLLGQLVAAGETVLNSEVALPADAALALLEVVNTARAARTAIVYGLVEA